MLGCWAGPRASLLSSVGARCNRAPVGGAASEVFPAGGPVLRCTRRRQGLATGLVVQRVTCRPQSGVTAVEQCPPWREGPIQPHMSRSAVLSL